jgi:SAM-dependent methyltransferase
MRISYRLYRKTKAFIIDHKPWGLTWLFYSALPVAERWLSGRRATETDRARNYLFRQLYFSHYSRQNPPFSLQTEHPLAVDSDDHRWPHGALYDNSSNQLFNQKLYDLVNYKADLKVLDLGCSGGAFVRSLLEDGYTAIGLEGSDISRKLQGGEWGNIPLHLFTADATKPFHFLNASAEKMQFDVVTAWEVLEHIPKSTLPNLIANIRDNLASKGYFIASIPTFPDANPLTNAVYHVTLEAREWWLEQFAAHGLIEVTKHHFETRDWVRGHGIGLTNWSTEEGDGFHLVLQKSS